MAPSFDSDQTDPGPDPRLTTPQAPARPFSYRVDLDVAGCSDAGHVRTNNEDHFIISRLGRFLETLGTNMPPELQPPRFEEAFYGMIVADGVGGGTAGEVASQTAIRTLVQLASNSPNWIFRPAEEEFRQALLERLRTRMSQIHEEMIRRARDEPDLKGFGTTMTLALSVGNVLFLAHLGDSRAYLLRGGRMEQLTRDHTLAQDLADKGMVSGYGMPVEKLRHVLTQALTDHARPVEPYSRAQELEDGDRVLLCSDGLTDLLDDAAIAAILGRDEPAEAIARLLVQAALDAGGTDNVTVIVAAYRMPAEE